MGISMEPPENPEQHHFGSPLNLSKVGCCEWCPFCKNHTDARLINEIRRCGCAVSWICAALPQRVWWRSAPACMPAPWPARYAGAVIGHARRPPGAPGAGWMNLRDSLAAPSPPPLSFPGPPPQPGPYRGGRGGGRWPVGAGQCAVDSGPLAWSFFLAVSSSLWAITALFPPSVPAAPPTHHLLSLPPTRTGREASRGLRCLS